MTWGAGTNEDVRFGEEAFLAVVPAVLDLDGNLVPSVPKLSRWGRWYWCIYKDDSLTGPPEFFSPSRARSADARNRANAAKGYRVGSMRTLCVTAYNAISGEEHTVPMEFSRWAQIITTEQQNDTE